MITPSAAHMKFRAVLEALQLLHDWGYHGIRLMVVAGAERQEVYLAPRKFFSSRDGLFIPSDLRHRAFKLSLEDDGQVPAPSDLLNQLEFLVSKGFVPAPPLNSPSGGTGIEPELLGLMVRDRRYAEWVRKLANFCNTFPLAFPRKNDQELLTDREAGLTIDFKESANATALAPSVCFEAPPPGVLQPSTAVCSSDPMVQVAQPRDKDAPSLLWSTRDSPTRDQRLDYWHESK